MHTQKTLCSDGLVLLKKRIGNPMRILKRIFRPDYVGNERYVFNIRGNTYRMVVVVLFATGLLIVRFLGIHGEYDKIDCKMF